MEKTPSPSKKRNFSGDSDNYEFDRNEDEVRPSLGPDGGEAGAVGSGPLVQDLQLTKERTKLVTVFCSRK